MGSLWTQPGPNCSAVDLTLAQRESRPVVEDGRHFYSFGLLDKDAPDYMAEVLAFAEKSSNDSVPSLLWRAEDMDDSSSNGTVPSLLNPDKYTSSSSDSLDSYGNIPPLTRRVQDGDTSSEDSLV